ncbi:MAG: glycosyltransferase family protein [Planctomycetaceae bacterium]
MKTVAIVQARVGSSRLPGKVFQDIAGAPMLRRVMDRLGRARELDAIVVATTTEPGDAAIEDFCRAAGWTCSRGSELDVLDRYHHAARIAGADVVVRITSDCPLIDPGLVDEIVAAFRNRQPGLDYLSNTIGRRTYPRGLDVEVFSFAALERAWREDDDPAWREHVTPYIYRRTDRFRCETFEQEADHSGWRWTVDTAADLEMVRRIHEHFGHDEFTWQAALRACLEHPEWAELNHHIEQKSVDRVA